MTIDVRVLDAPAPDAWMVSGAICQNSRRSRRHENVEWAERETIRRALEVSAGVKKAAAELIGISQRALSHYLSKHRTD